MTLLPLVIAALGAGLLSYAARDSTWVAGVIGCVGLAIVGLLAALVAAPAVGSSLGGEGVALGGFARLMIVTGALTGILLTILSLTLPRGNERAAAPVDAPAVAPQSPAPAFLLFLAVAALALGLADPTTALWPAAGGGLAAFVAVGPLRGDPRRRGGRVDIATGDAEVRALSRRLGSDLLRTAIALAVAVTAVGLLIGSGDAIGGEPFGVGVMVLGLAAAVGLRLGLVPVHAHALQLASSGPRVAVPLLVLWGPALFGLAVLGVHEAAVLPLELPLTLERGAIAGLGALTLLAGGIGALVQDDLDRAVAYSILQDVGFVLLAFAAFDASAWGPGRTWLLVLPLAKSALLAWSTAIERTYGTRSIPELRGWARRAPLLAASLALVTVATIGLPGLASWDARLALLRASFSEPLRTLVLVVSLSGVLLAARLLLVGVDRPTTLVEAGPDERLRRPVPELRRRVGATARETLDMNRAPLSAASVVVMALLAVSVGAGLFGLRAAASADLPTLPGAGPAGTPAPTFQPVPTESPSASLSGSGSASHAPTSRAPSPSPLRSPSPARTGTASARPTA